MNCPRCGLKEISDNKRDILIDCLSTVCGKPVYYCACSLNEKKKAKFWKANKITEGQARKMGQLALKVWLIHHLPEMSDCVRFNYGYYITPENHIICDEGNIDITDNVNEYNLDELE